MCGITGFLDSSGKQTAEEKKKIIFSMLSSLRHRGPDDEGIWTNGEITFGQRRLSILDLSPHGHQPMLSSSRRYVITYNGEIYNFKSLRNQLEEKKASFKGHSDTEVMLSAIEEWGLEEATKKFIGMFAFALWDRKEKILFLVRDRLGKKPLYYGYGLGKKNFLFASELKALRANPDFRAEINRDAIALFLRFNYIPSPYSIYKDIYKLLPGTILKIRSSNIERLPKPESYWSFQNVVERGVDDPFKGTEEEAREAMEALLKDATKIRMESDVPLGVFLSGGIDSSLITALMQAQSPRPIQTFTIGFHESGYNEADLARKIAIHLGTKHTEFYVTSKETMEVIPLLPEIYDEPFSDSSQIPTYLVSKLGRQKVTVALAGDGGDEVFSGYNRYAFSENLWGKLKKVPPSLRAAAIRGIHLFSPEKWETLFRKFSFLFPGLIKRNGAGDKLYKLGEILKVSDPRELYTYFISHWKAPEEIVVAGTEPFQIFSNGKPSEQKLNLIEQMMYLDTLSYLPDDILVKVDRASMAVSLEVRAPLLDHRVVEMAWSLPFDMKMRKGRTKWILREILYHYIPKELIERPKMGFGVPIDSWLRGPLREWADSLLSEKRLKEEGYFHPEPIRKKWNEHVSGKRNWHYLLWDILMFQAWLDETHKPEPAMLHSPRSK